jgi:transcriptional regulator with XRE-family HTH domain
MSAIRTIATVGDVSAHPGGQIKARRTAIGMSVSALAKRAGVDRGSLAALEAGGSVRDTTLAAVDMTLGDLEHEMGMDMPSSGVGAATTEVESAPIRLTFHDVFGVGEIIAEGPSDKPDELIAAVSKLLAELRSERDR